MHVLPLGFHIVAHYQWQSNDERKSCFVEIKFHLNDNACTLNWIQIQLSADSSELDSNFESEFQSIESNSNFTKFNSKIQ
jgi:hypothetical protein